MVPLLDAAEALSCMHSFDSSTTLVPKLANFLHRTLPIAQNPTLVLGCSPLSLPPLLSFRTKISLRPTQKRLSSHLFLYPRSCLLVTTRPSLPIKRRRKIPRRFLLRKACSPLPPSLTLTCPRRWRPQRRRPRSRSSPTMSRRRSSILEGPSSALNPSGNDRSHLHLRHPPSPTIITKTFIVAYQPRYLSYLISSHSAFSLSGVHSYPFLVEGCTIISRNAYSQFLQY